MVALDRDIPTLDTATRDRLLRRLGIELSDPELALLVSLVRAWLMNVPFHNLDLLAASLDGGRSLSPQEAVERCIQGLGGPCHVNAIGFASLVTACGFDAGLCGATVGQPGDHLLVRVTISGGIYLCDVGNGQPYLSPFKTDRVTEVTHLGWRMRAEPCGAGIKLTRWSPDLPNGKIVYHATPEPRMWADFAEVIALHHSRPGFGPFMTGLRAVRIGEARIDTLRDLQWTVYEADSFQVHKIPDRRVAALLSEIFRLSALPIERALEAWRLARSGVHQ